MEKEFDFGGQAHIFISTSTKEEYENIKLKLKKVSLLKDAVRDFDGYSRYKHNATIFISADLKCIGDMGQNHVRSYPRIPIISYQEFIDKYFIDINQMVDDLDKHIAKMERKLK